MARKVDIAPPTDREREAELRSLARRLTMSRISKPMRPTQPKASDFDTNLDFRNRLADEGLFPTPTSGKDTLPRRFNQPGYVPVWTPNPNEKGGYSVYGFPQVVSADDAVMGMGGGETLTMGPNEEAVSSSLNIVDATDRLKTAKNARPLGTVQGMIYHHSVAPTLDKTVNALNARKLGASYVIDRDGTIYRTFPEGMRPTHMWEPHTKYRTDAGKLTADWGNENFIGVEVAAADDADVTPAQVAAAQQLTADLSAKYGFPPQNVWGHGELQSNKQPTEGMTIVNAIRAANPAPPVAVDTAGRDKLAGVMLAEARGEGQEGMAGVGNVVLNRASAGGSRFPKTVDGVINDEFAPPLGPNDVSPDEWAEATQLATQLQNGAIPDNTGGAVYFANTATARPSAYAQIADSGPVSATIGNHTYHVDSKIGPVARTGAPQSAPAGPIDLAGLSNPGGGTLTPSVPPGTEAYAPFLPPRAQSGQAAIADLLGLPPPPVAQSFAPTVPETAAPAIAPAPFVPASGPVGPNLGSMLSPADVLNAGPRPRPAALSPVRPPMPNTMDRNLGILPPVPRLRPGGAPDAGMVPLPPTRPAPAASMANMPAAVGMPPSAPPGGVGAFSAPAAPSDLVPFLPPPAAAAAPAIASPLERANRIAGGQGGPVIPITPDEMRSSLANANANTEMSLGLGGGLGTPETAMSLARTFPPPRPSWDQLQSESDSRLLASDIARTRGMMERSMAPLPRFDTAPPPARPNFTPDFDFAAGPGPTFTPPPLTPDIRSRPEYPGSMPAAPPPLANAADDPYRAPSSFDASRPLNGGGGSDVLAAGNASPLPLPPSPFRYDPLSSIRVPLAVPEVQPIPAAAGRTIWEGGVPPEEPMKITSPVQDADVANQTVTVPPPLPTAANAGVTAPSQAKTPESQKRRSSSSEPSLLARIGNALVPGNPFGPGGGGVGGFGFGIGPGGFFANAGKFTPSGAGGTSFFNQQPNGQMGTTTWRQGSVTGNPAMSGTMWNRSGDNGSVGYVTDPFTGSMIYSGSPNRF